MSSKNKFIHSAEALRNMVNDDTSAESLDSLRQNDPSWDEMTEIGPGESVCPTCSTLLEEKPRTSFYGRKYEILSCRMCDKSYSKVDSIQ